MFLKLVYRPALRLSARANAAVQGCKSLMLGRVVLVHVQNWRFGD